jgi:hypothetical protein
MTLRAFGMEFVFERILSLVLFHGDQAVVAGRDTGAGHQ